MNKIKEFQVFRKAPDGTFCAKTFISNICERIERLMGVVLKSYETPRETGDHPEIDDTGFLNNDDHSKYRMLIGCGQFAIILGRFDTVFAIQTMARFSAAPKQGHIDRMLRVFGYLKAYWRYGIIIDALEPTMPKTDDIQVNWEEQSQELWKKCPQVCLNQKGRASTPFMWCIMHMIS